MAREEPTCPSKIGPYQLHGTIGSGGFGTVKLAFRSDQGRYYACKIIPKKRIHTEHQATSFEREIRILQQLHHPSLVQLCDLFKDSLNYYLMMEFCPNGDLFNVLVKVKRVPEEAACIYFGQILTSVGYIHMCNFAHRDLKPENIMIDEFGFAKLTDFGLAKYAPPDVLTQTSCGSPCYAAPEILSGVPYSPQRADMWSLGVILFTMVTGQLPWTKRNRQQLFEQIKKADFVIPHGISGACRDLIQGLMCLAPAGRLTAKQALAHQWVTAASPADVVSVPLPVVSLRRIDHFFERDRIDFWMPDTRGLFVSTTKLVTSCQKTVRSIQANGGRLAVSFPALPSVKVSPSMQVTRTVGPIHVLPSLKDLGLKIGHGKGRRIVIPRSSVPEAK
jgi:serine/threonine protein kinase